MVRHLHRRRHIPVSEVSKTRRDVVLGVKAAINPGSDLESGVVLFTGGWKGSGCVRPTLQKSTYHAHLGELVRYDLDAFRRCDLTLAESHTAG